MNSHHIYDYIFQTRAVVSPAKQQTGTGSLQIPGKQTGNEIGTYQIPPPPRPVLHRKPSPIEITKPKTDPYGTLRAPKSLVKISSSRKPETLDRDSNENYTSEDDDVFLHKENPTQNNNNNNNNSDRFGTLKAANRVVNRPQPSPTMSRMDDYRSTTLPRCHQMNNSGNFSSENHLTRDEVGLADELLRILDDFQKNSYSAKEMEDMFENWRRKADLNLPLDMMPDTKVRRLREC